MRVVPYPYWLAAATGGPPSSRHTIISFAAASPFGRRSQLTDTWPPGVDSAPYFAAFVTSSWSTIASAWVGTPMPHRITASRRAAPINSRICERHHAGLMLERPKVAFVNGMRSRRIVSCCQGLDLINAVKLSAGRQQLSRSLAWHRLFSQQPRLTFCASRADNRGRG